MEAVVSCLACGRLGVALWLHTAVDPTVLEWEQGIDQIARYLAERGASAERARHLVISDGGAPNAVQRASIRERLWKSRPSKLAVVTPVLSNPIKRGIATAVSWLNPTTGFFEPAQFFRALEHVDLAEHVTAIWAEFARMQEKLTPIRTLDLIADAENLPPPRRSRSIAP